MMVSQTNAQPQILKQQGWCRKVAEEEAVAEETQCLVWISKELLQIPEIQRLATANSNCANAMLNRSHNLAAKCCRWSIRWQSNKFMPIIYMKVHKECSVIQGSRKAAGLCMSANDSRQCPAEDISCSGSKLGC